MTLPTRKELAVRSNRAKSGLSPVRRSKASSLDVTDFGIPTPLQAQCSLTGYEDSGNESGNETVGNSSVGTSVSSLLDFMNRELMPNQPHSFEEHHENVLTEREDLLNDPLIDFDSNFEPVSSHESTTRSTLRILRQVQEIGELMDKNERRRERSKLVQKWRQRRRRLVLSAAAKLRIAQDMKEHSSMFHAKCALGGRCVSDIAGARDDSKTPQRCLSNPLKSCLKRHRESFTFTSDRARKRVRIQSFK